MSEGKNGEGEEERWKDGDSGGGEEEEEKEERENGDKVNEVDIEKKKSQGKLHSEKKSILPQTPLLKLSPLPFILLSFSLIPSG